MSNCSNQSSLFGKSEKYIKYLNSDLVAIEGANTMERQFLKDLRIPYSQILKARVTLKPGQIDYLLNYSGIGEKITLLSIVAFYDPKSKIESDNYVVYNYSDDMTKNRYFAQSMVLTGNSEYKIPQLYLTNPNSEYSVMLDIMMANIDDDYNFFNDTINQSGLSFVGLEVSDIKSYVVGESIVINDKSSPPKPLIYLKISNINSIERSGLILIIDDQSYGNLFLKFLTQEEANQAFSLINYVLDNPNVDIDDLNPLEDLIKPVIYFYSRVDQVGDYISLNGLTSGVPYNTSNGLTFSTSISLSGFGSASIISKNRLIDILVDYVSDNRDGTMSIVSNNIILTGPSGTSSQITSTGSYVMTFDYSDFAQNNLSDRIFNLNITN